LVKLKSAQDIKIIQEGGRLLAKILAEISQAVSAGMTTLEIEKLAQNLINKSGAKPSFLGYHGYPAVLCISINEEVVHGVPSERVIEEGDILSLDLGIEYKGFFSDAAVSIPVGAVAEDKLKLLKVTEEALALAISLVRPGKRWGDIAWEIQKLAESNGFGVVRDLVGHGVGNAVHEEPALPNFGKPGSGCVLREGMVLAIEPMFTLGDWHVKTLPDGWTVVTSDKSCAAHFEHTVAVAAKGALILTE
jgi:methionyl aminopeptidase